MNPLRVVEFDIHGKNPKNKISGEIIPILDKTCQWVIPDGSPFFGDYPDPGQFPITVVYDEAGRELVRDRDYWLEEEFMPLVEVTGRPVVCFIRLSEAVLAANKFIKVNYISVGAYFIPRNNIEEWLKTIQKGHVPVPWEKVFGVPPTVPSEWHSHAIKTEIGDWFEFTLFYTYVAENLSTRHGGEINRQLEAAATAAFARLVSERDLNYNRMRTHTSNYNRPHGILPKDVNMGNHPNYPTATLEEDRAGTAANRLSTPQGVQELLKDLTPDTSGAMRNGMVPLSKHSNGTYIPPNITGSFEGLGSRSECMGICLEEDGRMVIIQNHFDGRNEGLYYSTLTQYNKNFNPADPYEFVYTNYKYEPPVLKNQGVVADSIIMGSSNEVIMVGQTTTGNPGANDQWFVALTNNSFDPSGHRYIKTDISDIVAQTGPFDPNSKLVAENYHGRWSVSLIDDWVLLIVNSTEGGGNFEWQTGRISYWRIPKANLIAGIPSKWQLIRINYVNGDGVQLNNQAWWEYAAKQRDGNGACVRWGRYTFSPIPNGGATYFGRRALTMTAKKTGFQNVCYYNLLLYTFLEYTPPGRGLNPVALYTNMVYELNVATGNMTLLFTQPTYNVDYTSQAWNTENAKLGNFYNFLVRYTKSATIVTAKGEFVTGVTDWAAEMIPLNTLIQMSHFKFKSNNQPTANPEQLLSGDLSTDRIIPYNFENKFRDILTPIPVGLSQRCLVYEADGENFVTTSTRTDKLTNASVGAKIGFRTVTGDYAVRPQVTNLTYANLKSRPLVNTAYDTNMSTLETVINATGTAADLAARGIEMGTMALSGCSWSNQSRYGNRNLVSPSAAFRAKNETGAFLSFPKTHRREFDPAARKMNYIPNDYYGLAESFKNQVRSLIPAGKLGALWCFSLYVLDGGNGGMFAGMNSALLHVKYSRVPDGQTPFVDAQFLHVTLNVEAPNANHPGCYLVTGFNTASNTGEYVQHRDIVPERAGFGTDNINRAVMQIYRNGGMLRVAAMSNQICVGGTQYFDTTIFDINTANGAISLVGANHIGWESGDIVTAIPRIGLTHFIADGSKWLTDTATIAETVYPSGGSARIFPTQGRADRYATLTAYPEVAWALFILEEVEVLFSGTLYRMPTGTIDLRDIDGDPRNKVFYLYSTMEGQKPQYILTDIKLRQTAKILHAATITTGPNQILLIERRQPFLVGNLELSYNRKGGSIPVSSGFPQDQGNFTFLRAAELLP